MTDLGGLTSTNLSTSHVGVASTSIGAPGCETVQQILNVAATAEAFAVTALGGALANVVSGKLLLNAPEFRTFKAARAEEHAHYTYLLSAGARPLTTTFTIPNAAIVTHVPTFLATIIALEEAFIAAYLAAAQEFAILGLVRQAQLALQIGAVEAEHRAGARSFAIMRGLMTGTPNNVAFEKAMFTHVGGAAELLTRLGFIGGSGTKVTYPGPGAIDRTGVHNLRP